MGKTGEIKAKALSRKEKAQLILEVFPDLSETEGGKDLSKKLIRLAEESDNRPATLDHDVRNTGAEALLSKFLVVDEHDMKEAPSKSVHKTGNKRRLKPSMVEISGISSQEHPAVLLGRFNKMNVFERDRAIRALPGCLARQLFFLLASK